MNSRLLTLLLILALPILLFAQNDRSGFPTDLPIYSVSVPFLEPLDRTTPFISLKPGSVVELQNMKRPSPGVSSGWGPRRGMAKHNTSTALNSGEDIKSLHQYVNKDFGTRVFIAQVDNSTSGDILYDALYDPPVSGTIFASGILYTLSGASGAAFSDHINDDWVGAASSADPFAWSGGTAYPDGFVVVTGGGTPTDPTITNGDFEDNTGNDPADWTENNATAQTVTSSPSPHGGSRSVEITVGTADANTSGIYQGSITVVPGVEYTFTYWAHIEVSSYLSITNANFDTGGTPPSGWTLISGSAISNGSTKYAGAYAAHLSGSVDAVLEQTVSSGITASTTYNLSLWLYTSASLGGAQVNIKCYDSGDNFLGYTANSIDTLASSWTQHSMEFTTLSNTSYIKIQLKAPKYVSHNAYAVFDEMQVYDTSSYARPSIVIEEYDSGPALISTLVSQNNSPTPNTWTQYSASATPSATAVTVRVYLGGYGDTSSEVYFDDLTGDAYLDITRSKTQDGYFDVRNDNSGTYSGFLFSQVDRAYVGYRRPLKGVKLYLGSTVNAENSTITVSAFRDGVWTEVDGMSDGTSTVNKTLAKTGTITWDADTSDDPYLHSANDDHLFWYRLAVSGNITDGIEVYGVEVVENCQEMTNLSSGVWSDPAWIVSDLNGTYTDQTANLTDGSTSTKWTNASWATNESLYIGSLERIFAINVDVFNLPNSTEAAGAVVVKYYKASTDTWTTITPVTDGTADATYAFAQTGIIQWDGSGFAESQTVLTAVDVGVAPEIPMFWYELTVDDTSKADIFEIAVMTKPEDINAYEGVVGYHGRALWWPGEGVKGGVDYSQDGFPHILNGSDSSNTGNIFGDGSVNGIVTMNAGAIVSTKNPYRLYYLTGTTPSTYLSTLASGRVGAIAPHTLKYVSGGIRLFSRDSVTNAVLFLAPDGFYITDGTTVVDISTPISDYFDTTSAPYIEPGYMDDSYAWIDYDEKTIHFAVPINLDAGSDQTTLNRELVYSYLTDEWYDVYKRATPASCGLNIIGSDNKPMPYVGDYSGYVHRTDYSLLDGSTEIDHYLVTSPISPLMGRASDFLNYEVNIRGVKIKAKANAVAGSEVKISVFPDGKTTGITVGDLSLERTGYSYINGYKPINSGAAGTSLICEEVAFKFDNESVASSVMELYGFTLDFQPVRPTY